MTCVPESHRINKNTSRVYITIYFTCDIRQSGIDVIPCLMSVICTFDECTFRHFLPCTEPDITVWSRGIIRYNNSPHWIQQIEHGEQSLVYNTKLCISIFYLFI